MSDLSSSKILLCSVNASYIHASIGLRYLYANMGELQATTRIYEFTSHLKTPNIVETLLLDKPRIIGFGVYIWNVDITYQVVRLIKTLEPEIVIVIGGPEVSYEYQQQKIFQWADHLICGAADLSFARLCQAILKNHAQLPKVIHEQPASLEHINFPYAYYSDEDVRNRVIYVEASRGCPFKCQFCLSALDKTSIPFSLDMFLNELDLLYQRGARNFKFVDRTFNLKIESSLRILDFFLQRLDKELFVHFEIIPDRLPETLKTMIEHFPPGHLQFEVGVQSFNPQVQALISRKQNNSKTIENLSWLRQQSNAHIHADLIFGLPGEDLASFAQGFNLLFSLKPHDIQLGILKRLKGTPIIRHTQAYSLKFDPQAPYSIASTDRLDFFTIQRVSRFARYWELIANSGCFKRSLILLLDREPFERFMIFSDWLYNHSQKTHQISRRKLYDYLYKGLIQCFNTDQHQARELLLADYQQAGLKGQPEFYKTL